MGKRIISIIVLCVMVLSSVTFAQEEPTEIDYRIRGMLDKLSSMTDSQVEEAAGRFSDMDNHWSRRCVGKLTMLEIISGMPDGNFKPEDTVKVDEFIKMVVCVMGFRPGQGTHYWAQPYIDVAMEKEIIGQDEITDYRRELTREEAARIIVKATLLKEPAPGDELKQYLMTRIKDYPMISDTDKQHVLWAYTLGLMQGTPDNKFNPKSPLTRGEAGAIVIRNLDVKERKPAKPAEGETYTLTTPEGKTYTIYPPVQQSVIEAANAFKDVYKKSKGHVYHTYNPSAGIILYLFFENEEEDKSCDPRKIQMSVHLHTEDDSMYREHPFYITVHDVEAVKRIHRDVISLMFDHWFGNESEKAMENFNKNIELCLEKEPEGDFTEQVFDGRKLMIDRIKNGIAMTVIVFNRDN